MSNDETLPKVQARISEFSGTDFWSPSTFVPARNISPCQGLD